MTAQALEQSVLESKDKAQLIAIAEALGVKASARSKKSEIIDQILDMTGASRGGAGSAAPAETNGDSTPPAAEQDAPTATAATEQAPTVEPADPFDEPKSEWELEVGDSDTDRPTCRRQRTAPTATATATGAAATARPAPSPVRSPSATARAASPGRVRAANRASSATMARAATSGAAGAGRTAAGRTSDRRARTAISCSTTSSRVSLEPVTVEGYLDLRDEGYGFIRVNNYLASKSDSYVPVKLSRQYGLRRGDHVAALSRPAGRNEKNPAVLEIIAVNGRPPDDARRRPRFEDLTALFPDSRMRMEDPSDPTNMTARIIDLVCPIGKGQRGLIVSPPKAGKTTVMKTIAKSIEQNNPEVRLIVLLVDERPEEVTDMRRTIKGEVIASTFDKPSDQHTQIAEMAIEKAKRLVEYGEDVVVMLDGITRLSRAYNLAAPASGRILSGGIDAGALYPPKRFFGAARNVEEAGSLTILATALVETNSRMDEAVFEEFKGTGNMELRLDRKLAERRIYPAIDVDASSTRHEELLYDRKQLQMVWKLRRVLSGLAADGNAAPGLELLVDRLRTFRTNDEFLAEISKQPGM